MKDKATSPAKKDKQAIKPVVEMTVLDKAMREKELSVSVQKAQQGRGEGKVYTKQVFEMWMTLPDQFKGAPERITALLGINDPILLELLQYPTMQSFAEAFGVKPPTLSRWRGEMETGADFLLDVKKQFRKLTRNVIGSLYRKMLEEGDAARVMAWMKIVEDWREQLGIEHSGDVGETLTEEERKALDNLIAKNTLP